MFIYWSLCHSVIAASGKGPSLFRVLSSLQKLLLSQERDSRQNNPVKFPITVTMWEQLFASEGLPAIVHGALKQAKERKEAWREEKMKGKFLSAWFRPLKGFDIDLTDRPADVCVETRAQTLTSICGDTHVHVSRHAKLKLNLLFLSQVWNLIHSRIYSIWFMMQMNCFICFATFSAAVPSKNKQTKSLSSVNKHWHQCLLWTVCE